MHILVVEDHEDTRAGIIRLLNRCGYDVASSSNVTDALKLLDNLRFDVLLSDIGLPDGDGFGLVTEAKRRQKLKTAVALTAWSAPEDRDRGMAAGFDHYFTKPLDFQRLRGVLQQSQDDVQSQPRQNDLSRGTQFADQAEADRPSRPHPHGPGSSVNIS